MGNVEVAWEDIISVLQLVRTHLIVIVVALLCMVAGMILAHKLEKPKRGFVRIQSLICVYCGCGCSNERHAGRYLK